MTNAEINKRCAELMGIKFKTVPIGDVYYIGEDEILKFNPAEDISDAWKLVEHVSHDEMWEFLRELRTIHHRKDKSGYLWSEFVWDLFRNPKAPKAICQAFIKLEGK